MIIHVVKEGDTLYSIGRLYNVDYRKIALDDEISVDQTLVIGQTLVILTSNNNQQRQIEVNGFAFSNIEREVLIKALPSLTYLSIFSYAVNYNGNLTTIDDDSLIESANGYLATPIMVITNTSEGRFDSNLAHYILRNEESQDQLINNVLYTMNMKQYMGLDVDFEYVYPEDRESYITFLNKVRREIKRYNYLLFVALAPKTSDTQVGLLYEAHDYGRIGGIADRVIIMTYEWGYSGGPARAVAPVNLVEEVIRYAVTVIPSNKILMGIPNYGYDWTLPYVEGNLARSIGNYEAVGLARNYHQAISYDNEQQAPYFFYYDENNNQHEVWFEDARSIQAKLTLVSRYNLAGVSYWTLNRIFPQNYLVLNSMFTIKK